MNIQEAVKKAFANDSCITCTSEFWHGITKIKPTNTPDGCRMIMVNKNAPPKRGWQPQAKHLISDDWIVVD